MRIEAWWLTLVTFGVQFPEADARDRANAVDLLRRLTGPNADAVYRTQATEQQQHFLTPEEFGQYYNLNCIGPWLDHQFLDLDRDANGAVSARVLVRHSKLGFRVYQLSFIGASVGFFHGERLNNPSSSEKQFSCLGPSRSPELSAATVPTVPLGLPVLGKWRVVLHSDADPNGRLAFVDSGSRSDAALGRAGQQAGRNSFGFGRAVLAPASGEVVQVVDGWWDDDPGVSVGQNSAPDGNYIIIKHGPREYSILTHLKLNSSHVKRGQRVNRGEPIAEVGHSGSKGPPRLGWSVADVGAVGGLSRGALPLLPAHVNDVWVEHPVLKDGDVVEGP